ncbi:unnamed protein product [Paramecium sonneborni]|uniref:Uncharacterized protein n=1 Tax=Paramecium sonneborni TaxID=65129 RepID=A0A8S1NZ08_9CILI|nr:unnamed protein product [Paramecium sonneborni]CAD8095851.1 unnamed protein product [Paramecium sonneborni]
MFKPTVTFSEIQKRKKMIIGMHLMELSDRYRFFSIVGSGRSQNYKTTSNSQNKKQHFFTQKHSTTLPVTPTSKSPSFLESSRLLVLKQINITPRIKQLKPKALMRIRQQKTQTIDKNFNESFRQKESPDNPQQKKLKYSLKNQQSEISYSSDHDDFIDYVCNKKLI